MAGARWVLVRLARRALKLLL
ncbi:MAG: hypothetical protein QOJ27_418, partial [Sphingomonadales bacterium]|nr:hypothetical protein [Sphingomonadales bacterium]